jgi:hypothetical protein
MKLSALSERRIWKSFKHWEVDDDYANPMINYLVYAFNPGSFFTAVLANDFIRAIQCSHPANTIPALKKLGGWIYNEMPPEAWGSYEAIQTWTNMDADARREVLERRGLVFTPKEETWKALKGEVV